MKGLPPFQDIKPEHAEEALDVTLSENRETLINLLKQKNISWQSFIEPLEAMGNTLSQRWSPVSHLNAVMNNDELRVAYNNCLPKLSEYSTELGQNQDLFKTYKLLSEAPESENFSTAKKQVIDNALRDFHLSGIDLEDKNKQRYGEIQKRLSEIGSKYAENVLDSTQAWEKHIANVEELSGIPQSALDGAKQLAENKNKSGYIFNLEIPSYLPVMTYCGNQALRKELHTAFVTRASTLSPSGSDWDNQTLMNEILALRYELAQLLGFDNYGALSLATKMADKTKDVLNF